MLGSRYCRKTSENFSYVGVPTANPSVCMYCILLCKKQLVQSLSVQVCQISIILYITEFSVLFINSYLTTANSYFLWC